MESTQRLLRHKPSGQIFVYQEAFACRDDFEDVAPEPATEKPARRTRAAAAEQPTADEALGADASRNLP